jgi:preprotein translocase subunit SecE
MADDTRDDVANDDKGKSAKRKRTTPALFVRQVVAELRKVIWPTRSELLTYTTISLVFVLLLVGIVAGIDNALQWGIFKIFS